MGYYDYGARFYDPSLGRFHTVDPLADSTFNFTPYHYVINNPLMFIDPDGNRHIPINQVLNHYGYASREKQLFSKPSLFQRTVKVLNVAKNILDPSAPFGLSVMAEAFTNYTDTKDMLNRNPEKADRKDLVSYHENLKEVDGILSGKIGEVNKSIEALRAGESESGNLGLNNEQIKSQTKLKWDLEYEQISIQAEIVKITPIIEKPVVYK